MYVVSKKRIQRNLRTQCSDKTHTHNTLNNIEIKGYMYYIVHIIY